MILYVWQKEIFKVFLKMKILHIAPIKFQKKSQFDITGYFSPEGFQTVLQVSQKLK